VTEDLLVRLRALLAEAEETGRLDEVRAEVGGARSRPSPVDDGEVPMRFGMVGDSAPMRAVFELIERVAPSSVPVLIHGETGTGKELVAKAMHEHSPRAKKPLLAENCAAVSANLLESELFGHVRGSFTGAVSDRDGHFTAADGGTVFLDEIGDMPLEMQAKLLRVLETGEVRPVGSNRTRKVDVRLVAATHRDLQAMVKERKFREDLFYRLNVVVLKLPALREREGDVAHLVRYFLRTLPLELGIPENSREIAPEAREALEGYEWPGNVRQLENELRRALAMSSGTIGAGDLSPEVTGS